MTPKPKDTRVVVYAPEEIQRRFTAWASLPAQEAAHFGKRREAWDKYVDARDGKPEGFSKASYCGTAAEEDPSQLHFFARRYGRGL